MKVQCKDWVDVIKEIDDTSLISEVNEHGDLTIYRSNVFTASAIAHYAAGYWLKVDHSE